MVHTKYTWYNVYIVQYNTLTQLPEKKKSTQLEKKEEKKKNSHSLPKASTQIWFVTKSSLPTVRILSR